MRILSLILCLAVATTAVAYTDHRNARVDSAEQVLKSGQHISDQDRARCYYILIRGYLGKDSRKHDYYCHQLLALTYKIDARNMRENALYHLGLQHYGRDEYEKAEAYFLWGLAVTDSMAGDRRYSEADIDDNRSQLYGALGNLYNIQDKNLLAIEYYQKALPIFEKYGWLESQTILHHNVAELWLSMGNIEKAEQEYLRAIAAGTASGDSLMMALPRKGLTKVYLDHGDYDKTREVLLPAYAYYAAHQTEEHNDYAEILASMTKMFLMSGHEDLAKAKAYAREALSLDNGELMFETRADVYAAAAMTTMNEKQWTQALEYALESIHANDDEATISDIGSYEMLAQIYMNLGDKKKAAEYINKVRATLQRFATHNYQSGLSQMEVLYETSQKQEAIEQLTRQKRWYAWSTVLIAAALMLMALVFFLLWRSVKMGRRHAVVRARLEGELAERVRIAHDLHDRLGGILTALKMEIEQPTPVADSGEARPPRASALADEAMREMRNVAHHLLPDALSRYGLPTALSDYCHTMRNVSFSFEGDEDHIPHEEVIYCLVHELVNNAVKSADAQHISVQLQTSADSTLITVSDDGRGFEPLQQANGQGLRNIQARVAAIGGTLDIASQPGSGTEFNIEVPNLNPTEALKCNNARDI